ncbi:MAG: ABC transporter permease [Alphaproteobacteria bacterium]|nr:ABC transporter permease [Alphaproteobacteria bacterium]
MSSASPRLEHPVKYALFLPYAAMIFCFLIVPMAGLVEVSFRQQSSVRITGLGFTLANYARVGDPFYLGILFDTLRLAMISAALAAILGYPLAYVLARSSGRAKTALIVAVMVPLMTSVVVKVFGWYIILEPSGVINTLSRAAGWGRWNLLHNEIAVVAGLVEFSLPFMVLSLSASIERIPRSVEEAAGNLGAGPWRVMARVVLPMSRAGLLSGYLLCVGVSSSAYVVPAIMGGTRVRMAGQQIYDDVLVGFDWPAASAMSVVLVAILSLIFYAAMRIGPKTS